MSPLLAALKCPPHGSLCDHGSIENRVYSFHTEAGAHLVIKLYRPGRWSAPALEEELEFLRDLHAAGVPVVRPLQLPSGDELGTWGGIHYVLFEYTEHHRVLNPQLDDGALRELGRLAARIHEVGVRRLAPHRMELEPISMALENLRCIEQGELLPQDMRSAYRDGVEALVARGAPLFTGVPRLRLHGDLGVHNLLYTAEGPRIADLDDFMVGPAAFDLGQLHVGLRTPFGDPNVDEAARDRVTALFVDGYRDIRALPDEHLRPLEALRALRLIWNDAWKSARLHDASFRRSRSDLGSRSFWEHRLQRLHRQLAKLPA